MVIKTSICVALACAGLSPVAAGLIFHARHAPPSVAALARQASPWGALPDAAGSAGHSSQAAAPATLPTHLGLTPQTPVAVQTTTETDASETAQTRIVEQGSVSPDLIKATDFTPVPTETSPVPLPARSEAASLPAQQQAAVAPEGEPSAHAASDASGASPLVRPGMELNINTASVAELNHIPGMSNIGRAIVAHRPYRTVGDLVSHRVLKTGDFQRVKDKVKV